MPKQTTRSRATTRKSTTGKKATSAKKKSSARKVQRKASEKESTSADPKEVLATIDRRRNPDRRSPESTAAPPEGLERRQKVNRRRQIDPTTCERDYSDDEVEFMNALDEYKRKSGRMFPTCSEVLEVVRDLGYVKLTPSGHAVQGSQPAKEEVPHETVDA